MHPLGTGLWMLKLVRVNVKELNSFDLGDLESVVNVTDLEIVWNSVFTTRDVNSDLMALTSRLSLSNSSRIT